MSPLFVELKASVGEFHAKMNEAEHHITKLAKNGEKSVGAMGRAARTALLGMAAVAAAAFAAIAKDTLEAFTEGQSAMAVLQQAVANTGRSFEAFREPIEQVNRQMRQLGFTNVETDRSLAVMTQMLHNPAKAMNLMGLAANLARARHIGLAQATMVVGKAATGHVGLLARYGFATKDAAGHTLSAKAAIEKMAESFHGTAKAYSGTLAGRLATFHAQVDHLKEKVGAALIPVLSHLVVKFQELGRWLQSHVLPVLVSLLHTYEHHKTLIHALALAIGSMFAAYKIFAGVKAIIAGVKIAWIGLNTAMAANPIGIIILAVVGLAAALTYAWKHSETFRNVVKGAWHEVQVATGKAVAAIITYYIRPLVNAYLWLAEKIVAAVAHAFGWIPGLGGKLRKAQHAVEQFRKDTNSTLKGWAADASKWGAEHTQAISKAVSDELRLAQATKAYQAALLTDDPKAIARTLAFLNQMRAAVAADVAAAKKKAKHGGAEDEVNLDDGYADGLDPSNHQATHKAKAKAKPKHHGKTPAQLRAEAAARAKAAMEAAVAAAKAAAQKVIEHLRAELAARNEVIRAMEVQAKLQREQARDLSLVNGAVVNRGTTFAQLAGATTVHVHVAGSVHAERGLAKAILPHLQQYARTNTGAGLA